MVGVLLRKTKVIKIGLIQHEMKRCKGDKF